MISPIEIKLTKRYKYSATIILLAALTAIIVLMPKQREFKYELQKGKTWLYEDLYAPFDFVVLKTDAEIKAERDDLFKNSKPYFNVLKDIYPEQKVKFEQEFEHRFNSAISITQAKFTNENINIDTAKAKLYSFSSNILYYIYNKGISIYTDILDKSNSNNAIALVNNKIAQTIPASELFTINSAQHYVTEQINITFNHSPFLLSAIENINIYDFIKPNVEYDKTATNKARLAISKQLSTSRGMVQAGQLIIAHNEIMNDNNLRALESLRKEYQSFGVATSSVSWTLIGQIVVVAILLIILFFYFIINYSATYPHIRHLFFPIGLVVVMVGMMCLSVRFQIGHTYVLPFVILPIILKTFYDGHLAIFTHIITTILCGLITSNGYEFIFLQFVAGAVAIFCLSRIAKRRQLFFAVLMVTISYIITYTAISILQEGKLSSISLRPYMWFIINGLFLFVNFPLIFLFEKLFRLVSDITLLELSDTNHPLLRELAEKAPGTFQHVMQVSNLAEAVTRSIDGNSLLARVGALYHDIGKTANPQFFTENQLGESNPHNMLSNEQSAEIITGHITNGIKLAQYHKLPLRIIDFIKTHHGTDLVRYFYNKEVNAKGIENVDPQKFSYPGPSPFSKETAVVMFADAIEAASRSIKEHTPEVISELVDRIVNEKIERGQMNFANITFRDIETIKTTLKQKLQNIYHTRIEYPKIENKQ